MNQIIKGCGKHICSTAIGLLLRVVSIIDKDGITTLNLARETFLKYFGQIIDYNPHALYPSRYFIPSKIRTNTQPGELAIVIQGVIELKNDFTLETVRFYKKLFPNQIIIVSTWDFTPPEVLRSFEEEGCIVIVNKNFEPCGLGNINYQICTSFAGIKKAKELGCKYILKNRSDLRIYREFSFEYLKSLLELYPVNNHEVALKGRIITLSGLGPQIIATNGFQDFMYFGYTDDIYNLFDIPYDDRGKEVHASPSRFYHEFKHNGYYTVDDVCKDGNPEVYITTRFLSKYIKCGMTVKDSWQYHHDYFLVIDFRTIEAIWYKYQKYVVYGETQGKQSCSDRGRNYNQLNSTCIITDKFLYEDWLEEERFKVVMGSKANIQ